MEIFQIFRAFNWNIVCYYNNTFFIETRRVVDQSKRVYVPVEDDTEQPEEKRNKIYEKLQEHITDAVGVLYWKEQNKETGSDDDMQDDGNVEIPK